MALGSVPSLKQPLRILHAGQVVPATTSPFHTFVVGLGSPTSAPCRGPLWGTWELGLNSREFSLHGLHSVKIYVEGAQPAWEPPCFAKEEGRSNAEWCPAHGSLVCTRCLLILPAGLETAVTPIPRWGSGGCWGGDLSRAHKVVAREWPKPVSFSPAPHQQTEKPAQKIKGNEDAITVASRDHRRHQKSGYLDSALGEQGLTRVVVEGCLLGRRGAVSQDKEAFVQ